MSNTEPIELLSRVLFDGRPIRDPISGVARYCLEMTEALASRPDISLRCFIQAQGGKNTALLNIDKNVTTVHSRLFSDSRRLQNTLLEFTPKIGARLVPGNFNLIHETYFANLGLHPRIPKVVTIHDVIPLERPQLFNRRNVFFSRRNFLRQATEADCLIAVSAYTKRKILELLPKVRCPIIVIGNGVSTEIESKFGELSISKTDPLHGRPFVLHVGNIEPRKNLVTIANAFAAAFRNNSEWRLVFAGKRNFDADRILDEVTKKLGEQFIYLGPVSEERKWVLTRNARVSVVASEYEGYGIPVVESYAVHTSVLIADNSALSELAVVSEQLFETFDVDGLAMRLRDIALGAPWSQAAKIAGAEMARGNSWDNVAEKTVQVYKTVLHESAVRVE